MLFVVVVPAIAVQTPHAEVLLHHFEALDAPRALSDHELMGDLETGSITSPICSMRLSPEVDRKTSLSVDEAGDPAYIDQSFLLIVRIRRIVTARLANTVEC
jgi:hypothetical protein